MSRLELNLVFLMPPDPIRTQAYQDTVTCIRPENDRGGPPPKGEGDAIVLTSALVGLALGSAAGVATGFLATGSWFWLPSMIVGASVGTATGAVVGDTIRKHKRGSSPLS